MAAHSPGPTSSTVPAASWPEAAAKAQSSGGTVPTYLTNELANYQAGLNRLMSGSSSSSAGLI